MADGMPWGARDLGRIAARASLASAAVAMACSSSQSPDRASSSSASDAGASGNGQGQPDADNDASALSCAEPCNTASPCLALSSNTTPSLLDFRVRTLQIATPDSLKLAIVQSGLIDVGIALPNTCCEAGDGGFNMLLRLDTTANTITVGGARRSDDPINAGYCYLETTSNGAAVAPVTAAASMGADGTWSTSEFPQTFEIPIYAHGDPNNLVVLPLTAARIEHFAVSADGNCVGTYAADNEGGVGWNPVATLTGYITLEDADRVLVPDLGYNSLCTLLEPSFASGAHCTRGTDGKIVAKGDFCSTSDSAATSACADSVRLSATFAASAVRIHSCSDASAGGGGVDGATAAAPDAMAGSEAAPE